MPRSCLAVFRLPLAASIVAVLVSSGCTPAAPSPPPAAPPAPASRLQEGEMHLSKLQQLTFGGENAEAYWSFDGRQLVFQSRPAGEGCDQIFRMTVGEPDSVQRVSTGQGVTTCSYFMPGDQHIIYASTHLAGAACPPKPDHSQGYVWPLYDSYDIFKTDLSTGETKPLTSAPGYDAEATVCPVDGTILFTSLRDGDLELYKMGPDGQDVVRLTHSPGYDGGGFFNQDCSKIVWRASRPTGDALADYQRLLGQGLVRPTKLEIFVANADGSDARQVTYLNSASFAPYWFPNDDRILFSSNHGDARGREFELWAIDADGTELERITYSPGFDGFPMFSPDGKTLAFASNRATAEGAHDTNVFLAEWRELPPPPAEPTAAERIKKDIAWLAATDRQGRGLGTAELEAAGAFVETRLKASGLSPAFGASYRQPFEVVTSLEVGRTTAVTVAGKKLERAAALTGSAAGKVSAQVVFAGYGIVDDKTKQDDYAGIRAKDKIVLVRRFVPESIGDDANKRRLSDLRRKAFTARQRGAKALLVVDAPVTKGKLPDEAAFPALTPDGHAEATLPMLIIGRDAGVRMIATLAKRRRLLADVTVALTPQKTTAFNVAGRLPADAASPLRGAIVVGAHYDHLGRGGAGSLAPGVDAPHLGADDNASGVAALLEAARQLAAIPGRRRDVLFVAFSAEEAGVLGSSHFVDHLPGESEAGDLFAMLNMDMVGRLRDNTLQALGGASATEWPGLVGAACNEERVSCTTRGDGYGPSDQTPFYAAGVPVLHFFTGAHGDYHKPSDRPERVHHVGVAKTAAIVTRLATALSTRQAGLSYQKVAAPSSGGDRRSFGASLGTVPDYAGPKDGKKGMLLADARKGGAADLAGMKRGDVLTKLGRFDIAGVRDLMYALRDSKPGQSLEAVVRRNGKPLTLTVTLQKSSGRRGSSHASPGSTDHGGKDGSNQRGKPH
jgi:Tol biopolymer transport system component